MKIIFASKFYYRRAGLESYLFKLKDLMEKHGKHIIPFSTNYSDNYECDYSEYFCEYYDISEKAFANDALSNIKAVKNIFYNRKAYSNVRELIKNTKPDILQGFGVAKHLTYAIFKAAREMGIPTVMRLSDYCLLCPCGSAVDGSGKICSEFACARGYILRPLLKKCVHDSFLASLIGRLEVRMNVLLKTYKKNIDYFIAPSRFIRDIFIKNYNLDPEKIFYLPVFLEVDDVPTGKLDEGYFLYAGRLSREKGLYTLLKASSAMKEIKLIIAGSGPMEKELKEYAISNGLNVEFVGFKDYASLQDLIKRCRAVIIPSEWYENSPNIVLEAYSLAKPVIGSRIGGIPEMLEDNQTGLLYEMGNVEEMILKMKLLGNNKELATEMGEHAHKMIKIKYNPETHYTNLMKIYEKVLEKN